MPDQLIGADIVSAENDKRRKALESDYSHLGEQLDRRGIAIDAIRDKVAAFHVAVPSWGVGTGGTRFARFPGRRAEPRDIFDKLADCSRDQPADRGDADGVAAHPVGQGRSEPAEAGGEPLRADVRCDELQHILRRQGAGAYRYKFGSLSHADAVVREQAVEHNLGKVHRDRRDDRQQGADGVDWRRHELSRSGRLHPQLRALSRRACRRSTRGAARRTGSSTPSTRCTSRRSIRPSCRIGAPTT